MRSQRKKTLYILGILSLIIGGFFFGKLATLVKNYVDSKVFESKAIFYFFIWLMFLYPFFKWSSGINIHFWLWRRMLKKYSQLHTLKPLDLSHEIDQLLYSGYVSSCDKLILKWSRDYAINECYSIRIGLDPTEEEINRLIIVDLLDKFEIHTQSKLEDLLINRKDQLTDQEYKMLCEYQTILSEKNRL